MKKLFFYILLTGLWLSRGCSVLPQPAKLAPINPTVEPVAAKPDFSELDGLLKVYHRSSNRPLKERLGECKDTLDRLAAMCASFGPTSTPQFFETPQNKLVWLYNVRTLFSLYITTDCPSEKQLGNWLAARRFVVDGAPTTLGDIDAALENEFGYISVVGAPGVQPGRVQLARKHFTSTDIDKVVNERLNAFFDDDSCVKMDYKRKRILFAPVLWQYRDGIMRGHAEKYGAEGADFTSALLPLTSGSAHRKLQDAVGYRCGLLR